MLDLLIHIIKMNLELKENDLVIVTKESINNGYTSDVELIAKYLKFDMYYFVDYLDLGSWDTRIYLKGFLGIAFNSVNFEKYTPYF